MPKKKVTEAVEEVVQEPVVSEPVPPQAPRRQGSDDLLELNDLERGVTREDSEDAKWGYLAGAARRQQFGNSSSTNLTLVLSIPPSQYPSA